MLHSKSCPFFLPYNGIHLVCKHMLAFKGAIYAYQRVELWFCVASSIFSDSIFFMECFCAKVPFCDSKRCVSSAGSNAYVHIKISVARKAGKLTKAIRCNVSIEVRMMCIKPLILIWSMHL